MCGFVLSSFLPLTSRDLDLSLRDSKGGEWRGWSWRWICWGCGGCPQHIGLFHLYAYKQLHWLSRVVAVWGVIWLAFVHGSVPYDMLLNSEWVAHGYSTRFGWFWWCNVKATLDDRKVLCSSSIHSPYTAYTCLPLKLNKACAYIYIYITGIMAAHQSLPPNLSY